MEHLRRMSNLTAFLHAANPSLDSISRFLVLDTFSEYEPTAIILGLIQPNGSTMLSESFGINQEIQNEVLPLTSDLNNPLVQVMLQDRIIESDGIAVLLAPSHNERKKEDLLDGLEYSVAWPIHYVGAGILYFAKKPAIESIDELFFRAIGGLLVLHHAHLTTVSKINSDKNVVGPAGPAGSAGQQGIPGPIGATGSSGSVGSAGAQGATGLTGSAGAQGEIGLTGSAGAQGETGLQGLAGLRRNQVSNSAANNSSELTSRQLIILGELRRGKTNSTIALELNFSESLIRQEAMEIYRKMDVSGREDLTQSDNLDEDDIS